MNDALARLSEEAQALLRRILESTIYRQRSAANIRGHGLKLLPQLEEKAALAEELTDHLEALRRLEDLHRAVGGGDVMDRIRERMERIPYPTTRLDLAACLALTERAEQALSRAYQGSSIEGLRVLAQQGLEGRRPFTADEEPRFLEFAREAPNRPRAQECFDRWLGICLAAFGRPGSKGDARAVELGLRGRRVDEVMRDFLREVDGLRGEARLAWGPLPVGVTVPADLQGRFPAGPEA